jgi:hypothetical protein
MNKLIHGVTSIQALANRSRWWWQRRMGWAGAAALGSIVVGVAVLGAVRPALEVERSKLVQEQLTRLDALARQAAAQPMPQPVDSHDRWRDTIPPLAQRGESVARLLDLAGASGVTFDRAAYASADQEPNLSRLKITLPFGGTYPQTRGVIARVLNGLPNAALDSIEVERPDPELKTLEGTLRISLYFRKEAP